MREAKKQGGGVSVDFGQDEFTIAMWVKTKSSGPVFFKSASPDKWEVGSKVLTIQEEDDNNILYLVSVPRERRAEEDDPERHTDEDSVPSMAIALGQLGEKNIRDGEWHHVAMSSANQRHKFYVDGKPIESITLWNFRRAGPDDPEHSIFVSLESVRLFRQDVPGYKGDIDEFQIYSRKITDEEVASIYRDPGAVKDGLAGWWPFDEKGKDVSGYDNDGEVVNGKSVEGKFGKAISFNGDGYAKIPTMPAKEVRDKIMQLAGRDFTDEQSKKQMKWEAEDKIWNEDWKEGDLKEIGERYAKATRKVLGLPNKAKGLASDIDSAEDLEKVRQVYYLSRQGEGVLVASSKQMSHMLEEIEYLADVHTEDDKRWNDYKKEVAKLNERSKSISEALEDGDESAVEKLTKLHEDLLAQHDLLPHKLPSGVDGPARFGAVYDKLKYTLAWDKLWRVSKDADIVVQFDDGPYKFVFWRGCSYIPCWATEHNGPWFTNEFFERRGWLGGGDSMMEPMSDKQCRYSHVRLIENTDARVVVHWRYTPCDLNYNVGYIDSETKWGDWADEYWTIYPDGIAMRKATLFSSGPLEDWIEYQESIFINQPGTKPSDNIPWDAVTLANLDGETQTYKWERQFPPEFKKPENPCIQLVNFRTKYKQFSVVTPEELRVSAYPKDPRFKDDEYFNTWDAWPVSQDWSDARKATNFNRVSHSNLTHIVWKPYVENSEKRTWLMLTGMTDKKAEELTSIARSWLMAPELDLQSGDVTNESYDMPERAYVMNCKSKNEPSKIEFELKASKESPVVNAAFVINGWGADSASLMLNGKKVEQGKDFRIGHRRGFDTSDLIIWVRIESDENTKFVIEPVKD
ncbi:MAG: LamG-like jellyroll fold domain-containing protein [Planctomycetota bacterium]|jgi:hypothetical protein